MRPCSRPSRRSSFAPALGGAKGFTLIELLIVIAIIGVLATLLLGALSAARRRTAVAVARSQIGTIKAALAMYEADMGKYPRLRKRIASGGGGGPSSPGTGTVWDSDAAALYAALRNRPTKATGGGQNSPYLQDWRIQDIGLVGKNELEVDKMGAMGGFTTVRKLTEDEQLRIDKIDFQKQHAPDQSEPLVLLDPWGNPYHYREWASVRTSTKDGLLNSPQPRKSSSDEGNVVKSAKDQPHALETFDLWSNGPNGVNEWGDPDSDDVTSWGSGQ